QLKITSLKNGKSANDNLIWLHLKMSQNTFVFVEYFVCGKLVENNTDDFGLFLDAANGNDIIAIYFVGRCYVFAEWKLGEYSKAFKLFRSAADKEKATENMSEGFKYLKQAAEMGEHNLTYELARCYADEHQETCTKLQNDIKKLLKVDWISVAIVDKSLLESREGYLSQNAEC
ncbi:5262_t:CDS:2, partial [Dentiscutata erythropus]